MKEFCDISNKILQGEVSINPWTGPWTVVFGGSVLLQGVYECHRRERRYNALSAPASNKVAATVAAAAAVHLTRDHTHHYQAAENRQIGSEKKSR